MNKIIATIMSLLMVFGTPVLASEHHIVEARLNASAGVTPDSIFYGLEKAMENIQAAMTRAPEAKARLHLGLAEERLAEMEAMAEANNEEAAEEARRGYEESAEEAEENAMEADADVRADVEARLQTHVDVLSELLIKFEGENGPAVFGLRTALSASQNAIDNIAVGGNAEARVNGSTRADIGNGSVETDAEVSAGA